MLQRGLGDIVCISLLKKKSRHNQVLVGSLTISSPVMSPWFQLLLNNMHILCVVCAMSGSR